MFHGLSFKKTGRRVLALLAATGLCASAASAHHGGGAFDPNKCFVFKGTVRQLAWTNPHSWIYVQAAKEDGTNELWGFEFGTVSGLARAGFRPSDFPVGTKVTVTAHVNRAPGRHTGSSSKLVLPNGRVIGGAEALGSVPGGAPGGARKPVPCPAY
ncbi:hypothetical protein WSK_1609 [Novosphingobium sp. Rr 2-17]|uniref:DUF6152 family protein n=1 Tax=Novosphingobium sp. Rr 2-17 TaxID=555793 RepID=UPI0002699B8B|nr:DUF6152 family protein [Novosphingobium sp. Rr 2-17]EIZ79801.1 hypothetical protein WSK_1609 [Novosphingobium sp. Rr 2-17]